MDRTSFTYRTFKIGGWSEKIKKNGNAINFTLYLLDPDLSIVSQAHFNAQCFQSLFVIKFWNCPLGLTVTLFMASFFFTDYSFSYDIVWQFDSGWLTFLSRIAPILLLFFCLKNIKLLLNFLTKKSECPPFDFPNNNGFGVSKKSNPYV